MYVAVVEKEAGSMEQRKHCMQKEAGSMEQRKHHMHEHLANTYRFLPLPFETLDSFGSEVKLFLYVNLVST